MAGGEKQVRADFAWAWETSASVTEVSVKMRRLGYYEFDPDLVREYARALKEKGAALRNIRRGSLPDYVEAPPPGPTPKQRPEFVRADLHRQSLLALYEHLGLELKLPPYGDVRDPSSGESSS